MDKNLGFRILHGLKRKVYASLKQLSRLWLKVVFRGVSQHLQAILLGQPGVVELDLHIDDVGNHGRHPFDHFLVVPDTSTHPNLVGHPRNVHSRRSSPAEPLSQPHRPFYRHEFCRLETESKHACRCSNLRKRENPALAGSNYWNVLPGASPFLNSGFHCSTFRLKFCTILEPHSTVFQ